MPKQDRRPHANPSTSPGGLGAAAQHARPGAKPRQSSTTTAAARRSTYGDAVAIYEAAMAAFQRRDFASAAEQLRRILTSFPQETELAERARLHLTVCERRLQPLSTEPQSIHERLYAATMALNEGVPQRALEMLDGISATDPRADQAFYLRAVALTDLGDGDRATELLRQAISLNADNRPRARVDPDLAALREIEGVEALLEPPRRVADPTRRVADPPRSARTRR